MIELTTIYDERTLIRLEDIRAIESRGNLTIIMYSDRPEDLVCERFDYIRDILEEWLKRK